MVQTIVYLIRHGQTEWNLEMRMQGHKNSPLTRVGITQAKGLHNRLIKEKLDLICSSESKRAYDTARIIKGHQDIPIYKKSGLKEINMGEWEGMKQSDIINIRNTPDIQPASLSQICIKFSDRVAFISSE